MCRKKGRGKDRVYGALKDIAGNTNYLNIWANNESGVKKKEGCNINEEMPEKNWRT